jgi:hypothetical protein
MKMNIFYTCPVVAVIIASVVLSGCVGSKEQNTPPVFTKSADVYEALSSFDGALESTALDWKVNSSLCESGLCRQQLIAENGDQVVVTVRMYQSGSEATNAYTTMKKGLGKYTLNDVQIADTGYAWHSGSISESGFLSGQIIGVVDYQRTQGNATGQESTNLATFLAESLIK